MNEILCGDVLQVLRTLPDNLVPPYLTYRIEMFSQAPLLVLDIGNVIRLCQKCHLKLQGRENWWRKKLYRLIQSEGRKPQYGATIKRDTSGGCAGDVENAAR